MTFILVEDSFSMNQFSKFGINQGWILFVESINQGMILSAWTHNGSLITIILSERQISRSPWVGGCGKEGYFERGRGTKSAPPLYHSDWGKGRTEKKAKRPRPPARVVSFKTIASPAKVGIFSS